MTAAPLVPPEAVAHWLRELPQPVAVTGGTGFVGSHLVEVLASAGMRPRVLVRDPASPRWIGDSPAELIGGGTQEIQLTVIASMVLGLPRG